MNAQQHSVVICLLVIISLLSVGCGPGQLSRPTLTPTSSPAPSPTSSPTLEPTFTPIPEPTFTRTPIPTTTPSPTPTIDPAAANFGDPILSAIHEYPPIFEDDFSNDRGWVGTLGWDKRPLPLSLDGEFLQTLEDGERTYTHIQNLQVDWLRNYAVMVDAAYMISPAVVRNRAIGLCWWPGDDWGERFLLYESGMYEGATCTPTGPCPAFVTGEIEPIPVEHAVSLILIHRKGESVVYVNGVPVVYHLLSVGEFRNGFSLCPHTFDGSRSSIKYDNVRVWNLDQISGLP